jgi:YD repeat-containing protein
VTDANGNTTRNVLDVWGRTTDVIPPTGPSVEYNYDAADHLIQVVSNEVFTTTLEYDLAGRKIEMDDPDMGIWTYSYNALGFLTSQTDARGCITTLSYDLNDRLTGKSFGGTGCGSTTSVTYTYDNYSAFPEYSGSTGNAKKPDWGRAGGKGSIITGLGGTTGR